MLMDFFASFKRSYWDERALRKLQKRPALTRFGVACAAMRGALRVVRYNLAAGRFTHCDETDLVPHRDDPFYFCMGWYPNSLLGIVEMELGLARYEMMDLMRDMPPTPFNESLWELFYPPSETPYDYSKITPDQTVVAIDRWLAGTTPWNH